MTPRPFVVLANLDQEARWSGLALPDRVARRVSAAAALLSVLAPHHVDVEIFAPAPVAPERVRLPRRPALRTGIATTYDLAWCDPQARAINDRRFARALARELEVELPGARAVTSLDELAAHVAGAAMTRWVCKAVWSAAGRDRAHGVGATIDVPTQTRVTRLLARCGALVVEPWCERLVDVGVSGQVGEPPPAPHLLVVDTHGTFRGIAMDADGLLPAERDQLVSVATACSAALARTGYRGAYGIDAFAYRDVAGQRRFHPLCELNARYTFGHVARALCARYGGRQLGFGAAPEHARVLVAATDDDPVSAWLA
jgi:hypothetical protein